MQHVLAGAALVLVDGAVDQAEQESACPERAGEGGKRQAQGQGEDAGGEPIEGGLDAGIPCFRIGAGEERRGDGETHRVQLGHPGELAEPCPAARVTVDHLFDGGEVLLERVSREGLHQEALAAPLLFAVEEGDRLRVEQLLDVRRVRSGPLDVLVVEDQGEGFGTDEARGGSAEDVDAEDRAQLPGAFLQEARGVAHERKGVADERQ